MFQKGHTTNKGKKLPPRTHADKDAISARMMGNKNGIGNKSNLGRHLSISQRRNISNANKGSKSYRWRGGITPTNEAERQGIEYRLWRFEVYERDNYTCVHCGVKGGWNKETKTSIPLHADHIKPFAYFPELRYSVSNGRTLCKECHQKTDTFGWKAQKHCPQPQEMNA